MTARLDRLLPLAVLALAVLDGALFAAVVIGARAAGRGNAVPARDSALSVEPPIGYSPAGKPIRPPADLRCWAVRYEAGICRACVRDDRLGWGKLGAALQRLGCPVFVLPPGPARALQPGDLVPRAAQQEVMVDLGFVRYFRLNFSPETLLFGPGGRLIWTRQGALAPSDPGDAERALARALAKSAVAAPRTPGRPPARSVARPRRPLGRANLATVGGRLPTPGTRSGSGCV